MCRRTCIEVTTSTPHEPVSVWFDETGQVLSDLGPVDRNCVVRVIGAHCPDRGQWVLLYRAPGPRLLYGGELMSELDDERGIYFETHAKHLEDGLISIAVDHVGPGGGPASWRYRLLPMRWKTEDGLVPTATRLAVWPD
jgi:hypothetical protein